MSADFTPTMGSYTELKPFRYWCQKVLPLVYDDTLSYYELLCKVVDYLNHTMEDVNALADVDQQLNDLIVELRAYVDNYFNTLDLQDEVNTKLDQMAADGTLNVLLTDKLTVNFDDTITPVQRNVHHVRYSSHGFISGQGILCIPETNKILTSMAAINEDKILLREFQLGTNNLTRSVELNIGHGNCFTYKDGMVYIVDSYNFRVYELDYLTLTIHRYIDLTEAMASVGASALATCQYDPFTGVWYLSALISGRTSVPLYRWDFWTQGIEEISLPETEQTLYGRQGWYVFNNFTYGIYAAAYTISVYDLRTKKLVRNMKVATHEAIHGGVIRELESIAPVSHLDPMCNFVMSDSGVDCKYSNWFTYRVTEINMYKNLVDNYTDSYEMRSVLKYVNYESGNIFENGSSSFPYVSPFSYGGDKYGGFSQMLITAPSANIGGLFLENVNYAWSISGTLTFSNLVMLNSKLSIHGAVSQIKNPDAAMTWDCTNSEIRGNNWNIAETIHVSLMGCRIVFTTTDAGTTPFKFLFDSSSAVKTTEFIVNCAQNAAAGSISFENFNAGNFGSVNLLAANPFVVTKWRPCRIAVQPTISGNRYYAEYYARDNSTQAIQLDKDGDYFALFEHTSDSQLTISIKDTSDNLVGTGFYFFIQFV